MEAGKVVFKHAVIPLVGAALTGGTTAVVRAVGAVVSGVQKTMTGSAQADEDDGIDWSKLIAGSPDKPDLVGLRKFRGRGLVARHR